MLIKDRLTVEHTMNSLRQNYRWAKNADELGVDVHARLDFTHFILEHSDEEIAHAINYIRGTELYDALFPIILEYQTFGLKHFKEEVPQDSVEEEIEEEEPKTFIGKLVALFRGESDGLAIIFKKG